MTAREVMKELVAMSPEERAQVFKFLQQLQSASGAWPLSDQEFEEISDRIFERHDQLFRKLAT